MPAAILALVSVLAAFAQAPATAAGADQEVRQFADTIDAALKAHDGVALEAAIADGFEFVHSTGRVEDRASFIQRAAAGRLASQRTPGDQIENRFRIQGDTAIRLTKTSVRLPQAEPGAAPMVVYTSYTYGRIQGRWRWLAAQSTTAAAPADASAGTPKP